MGPLATFLPHLTVLGAGSPLCWAVLSKHLWGFL